MAETQPTFPAIETPLSGYSATEDYFATGFNQGELKLLSVQMSLGVLIRTVKVPDPEVRGETNRRISTKHARDFGEYLEYAPRPYVPPIILWTAPDNVEREPVDGLAELPDGTRFVIARFDKTAAGEREIVDGQHRILGTDVKLKDLQNRLSDQREKLGKAEANDDPPGVIGQFTKRIEELKRKIARIHALTVTVQILLTNNKQVVKQVFADVADNAMGINKSVLTDFDTRSVFNRVASTIAETDLHGVVEWEKSRLARTNTNWLALKDVAQIVQGLEMSFSARWSPKVEEQVHEKVVAGRAREFLGALRTAYPELEEVVLGERDASEFRRIKANPSLLGSSTVLRVLAHAARELTREDPEGKAEAMTWGEYTEFLKTLPMQAGYEPDPRHPDDPEKGRPRLDQRWLKTGLFAAPWIAPTARFQDLKALTGHVVRWARDWQAKQAKAA
jgi:hypothetical protein